jgi:hypothetical protein
MNDQTNESGLSLKNTFFSLIQDPKSSTWFGKKKKKFKTFSPSLCTPFLFLFPHPHVFWRGGGTTQVLILMLARQVLYHLSHFASPFCIGYLWDKVLLFALASLYHDPHLCPLIAGWQACATTPRHCLRCDITKFLPGLTLNHNPLSLHFPSSFFYF